MNENLEIERSKHIHDYLKYITTLSTGSILLMATLWEKMSFAAEWLFLVKIAIIAFLISIIGAIATMTIALLHFGGKRRKDSDWQSVAGGAGLIFCWLGFLVAVISLTTFVLKNFG
ncbi:MAG: hypothetical protein A2V66_14470 [Ignavibacteria bacterium RBG_13_36_8]|nr:MAG: hypothetical protein A2V66_14470 [Ignavibacteria bacterium RBG_13_36_8]